MGFMNTRQKVGILHIIQKNNKKGELGVMKKVFFVIVMVSMILFSGCSTLDKLNNPSQNTNSPPKNTDEVKTSYESVGNTYGNIINGGYAVKSTDKLYYIKDESSGNLYKANSDWSEEGVISTGSQLQYINVMDEWIFYSDKYDDGIYKIKTDGTDKVKITDDKAAFINVVGNWIYYCNLSNGDYKTNNKLYKIKVDGTEKTKLTNEMTSNINVINDWIYYLNWIDEGDYYETSLCKIKIDGTSRVEIIDECNTFVYNNEWVYYINSKDERLYKLNTKNNDDILIVDARVKEFNINGDWIYYVKNDDFENMYKIKVDGSSNALLSEDRVANIHVLGEWLFYDSIKAEMPSDYYRMKLDGTMKSAVNGQDLMEDGDLSVEDNNADYEDLGSTKADSYYEDEFIRAIIRGKIEAVNDNDFGFIEKYLLVDSNAYKYLKEEVAEMNKQKVNLELVKFDIKDVIDVENSKEGFIKEFHVQEEILYQYPNNNEKKINNTIYVVKYSKELDEFKLIDIR